jgi:hypothetical protein
LQTFIAQATDYKGLIRIAILGLLADK